MVQAEETLVQDEQVLEQRKPKASKKDAGAEGGAEAGEEVAVNGSAEESNAKAADPAAVEASAEAREQDQWRKRCGPCDPGPRGPGVGLGGAGTWGGGRLSRRAARWPFLTPRDRLPPQALVRAHPAPR